MGAPLGNQNAIKAKRWMQAVDRALEKRSKAAGIEELDRLAEVYLDTIEDMTVGTEKRGPSIAGFADLADRTDGKATQAIVGANDGPVIVEIVRFADKTP
ncbi:MAG: hypothetical protein Q7J84_18955 [Sulfuricaulis sp.]|nr:hypothetical protein [Sulfuricaulis sp.]